MNRPSKSMSDLRRMVVQATGPSANANANGPALSPLKSSLSTSEVHNTLAAQVGQLDLGVIGNLRARMHQRAEDSRMQRTLTTARVEQGTALMLEKLNGEVEIVRMAFKQDFSDRIAALAESAAASQFMVMRKLKAIEAEARNFVMYDFKAETDELQAMLNKGVIDEETLLHEVAFRMQRYEELKNKFSELVDGYQGTVQNTYQRGAR